MLKTVIFWSKVMDKVKIIKCDEFPELINRHGVIIGISEYDANYFDVFIPNFYFFGYKVTHLPFNIDEIENK